MPHVSAHLISKDLPDDSPLWEKYAWRTRANRLDSLKLDPNSFISQYDSEVKQPIDFTIGRLKEKEAWTVVLVQTPTEEASKDPDVLLNDSTEYVGFCVMIDIRKPNEDMVKREGSDMSTEHAADWFMAAVYVARSVRGTGAGKNMVQFAIDTIREVSPKLGMKDAVLVTDVMHGNTTALEMYKKLGLNVTADDFTTKKEGKTFHTTQLKMAL